MWRLPGKAPDAGKDWRQEEKGATEGEMVGWHHWLNEHEFEQALGDSEGREAWWATVHGVAKSRTQLNNWTTTTHNSEELLCVKQLKYCLAHNRHHQCLLWYSLKDSYSKELKSLLTRKCGFSYLGSIHLHPTGSSHTHGTIYCRGQNDFSIKSQIVNILVTAGHTVFVTNTHICCCSIDNYVNKWIKLCSNKTL